MPTAARPAQSHSHPHAGGQSGSKPKLYNPRHPERTLFYQTIAERFETWHALASAGRFDGQGDLQTPKSFARQAFRKYLECGIFAHGFARAWCDDCGHDYFVAYSCTGRGVCPSCNTRRMVETAAQVDKAALHSMLVSASRRTTALRWCTAAPNSTANRIQTSAAPRWTSCTSRHCS